MVVVLERERVVGRVVVGLAMGQGQTSVCDEFCPFCMIVALNRDPETARPRHGSENCRELANPIYSAGCD